MKHVMVEGGDLLRSEMSAVEGLLSSSFFISLLPSSFALPPQYTLQ